MTGEMPPADVVGLPAEVVRGEGVLVIIPTYQERLNVENIVSRVRASVPMAHVLVVDDASPDGTGALADALAATDTQVHVLHRAEKVGLGVAYLAGFGWGLERDYEVLVEMDADGSHQPEQLPRLLAALPDADLVLGSRWVPGGSVVNWPARRKALKRVFDEVVASEAGFHLECPDAARLKSADSLRRSPIHQSIQVRR